MIELILVDAIMRRDRIRFCRGEMKRTRLDINAGISFRRHTGLCPICKRNESGKGVTCGSAQCVSMWTIGYMPFYYSIAGGP